MLTGRHTRTGRQENRQSTSTGVATASASPWMRAVKSTSYTELAPDAVFRKLMDQSITRPETAELSPAKFTHVVISNTCCWLTFLDIVVCDKPPLIASVPVQNERFCIRFKLLTKGCFCCLLLCTIVCLFFPHVEQNCTLIFFKCT